jgi:hypothetical protein
MTALPFALPMGIPAETLAAALVGLLTLVNVVVLWRSLIEDRPRASRARDRPPPAGGSARRRRAAGRGAPAGEAGSGRPAAEAAPAAQERAVRAACRQALARRAPLQPRGRPLPAGEAGLPELNVLPERRQALANLAKRGDVPALRGVVNALIQTERYGTPLAQALRVLSAELRDQRMLRAEEKAARLPALLTVPMIVFILPTLFIVLIGPALIGVLTQMAQ